MWLLAQELGGAVDAMEADAETTRHLSVGEGTTTAGPIFSTHYNATIPKNWRP